MITEAKSILEAAVQAGQPLLDAETANWEVIRLTVENIRLQTRLSHLARVSTWNERASGYYPGSLADPRD
jgi:hypothetical protein